MNLLSIGVFLLLFAQDEFGGLLRKLSNEDIRVREAASNRLIDGFSTWRARLEEAHSVASDHEVEGRLRLILAEGKALKLAGGLGLATREEGIVVDFNCQTGSSNLYAVGRCVRRDRSQAVISAGEGAVAALDILSKENGEDFCDFDTVDDG